jgi:hypothetical protein
MKLSIASAFYATLVLAPWSTTPVNAAEKYNSFISTSDLKAAVTSYCTNPQGWESDDLFNTYGYVFFVVVS